MNNVKCVDLKDGNTANGSPVVIMDCNDGLSQQWSYNSFVSGEIKYRGDLSKCIDLTGGDATNGVKLQLWDCNGHNNQMWWGGGTYQYLSSMTGSSGEKKCIDLYGADVTNGKQLELWDCVSGASDATTVNAGQRKDRRAQADMIGGPSPDVQLLKNSFMSGRR
jgi:hypothetical protein